MTEKGSVTAQAVPNNAPGNNRTVQGTPAGTASPNNTPTTAPGNNRTVQGTPQ